MTKSILVIDDDPRICQLICAGFERKGYLAFSAPNGRAGLKIFAAERPDVVVTDILMPEMEGIETIMRLKRAPHAPKVIAISGGGRLVGREFLRWAEHLGADAVMAKPFRISALVNTARELTSPPSQHTPPPQPAPLQKALRRTTEVLTEGWETLIDRHGGPALYAA